MYTYCDYRILCVADILISFKAKASEKNTFFMSKKSPMKLILIH